jgi:diketogulonate reductase-like aldo/keto reductase
LRWLIQQDIVVIPRTSRIERLAENFALSDFKLADAEMAEIGALASRDGRIVDYAYSGSPEWD